MWIGVVCQCVMVVVVLAQGTAGSDNTQHHCQVPVRQQPVRGTTEHPMKETTEHPMRGTTEPPTERMITETPLPGALIITAPSLDCPKPCDVRLADGRCKPDLNCLLESAPHDPSPFPQDEEFLLLEKEKEREDLELEGRATLSRVRDVRDTAVGNEQLETCAKVVRVQKKSETRATVAEKKSEGEENSGSENSDIAAADEGTRDLGVIEPLCRGHCTFKDISGHCRLDLVCLMGRDHDSTLTFFSDFPAFAPAARALALSVDESNNTDAPSLPSSSFPSSPSSSSPSSSSSLSTSSTLSSTPEERVAVTPLRDCPNKCQVRNVEGECVIDHSCPDGMA